uniref:Uncharacterized protein n=1 Tax=Romanomermis culicivorax TaxID=13658 RepID=A0A915JCD9_ROMCU
MKKSWEMDVERTKNLNLTDPNYRPSVVNSFINSRIDDDHYGPSIFKPNSEVQSPIFGDKNPRIFHF